MQHTIPIEKLSPQIGPQLELMTAAIEACVHCGFCLPTCPTYQVLGEEMDSPRGRIILMKSALEGSLAFQDTLPYIDLCLGCQACVTICPSGVKYHELLNPYRAYTLKLREHPFMSRLQRTLIKQTIPHPQRFRLAASLGRLAQPFKAALPKELQSMLDLLPEDTPPARQLPDLVPAEGRRRARVALLAGCVQQVVNPEINWATLRVLARNGVEVIIPHGQGCCGALHMHAGEEVEARTLALNNIAAFPADVDAVITTAAGCGSAMKEYGALFKGLPDEARAAAFAKLTKDVSLFLSELGLLEPPPLANPLKVAYHDACHLAHAQKITEPPRKLLSAIGNLTLVSFPQAEICCGSAGSYNIEHPDIAFELGKIKVENILQSGCDSVVTGNIGCLVQLQTHLREQAKALPVYHTMQVLDMAYQNGTQVS